MFDRQDEAGSYFLREVNLIFEAESARLNAATLSVDTLFVAYLRFMSRFGFFTFGPVTIDVSLVEDILERTIERRPPGATGQIAVGDDVMRFSTIVMDELRRSGRPHIDELHYLLAFMRVGIGLPGRVFSELGVTPEQVEAYARTRTSHSETLEKLYSPEEVAEYLNVHVQTVRTWIRSGRLPARRLAGHRALRVKESDMQALLEPLDQAEIDPAEPETGR
jgi:excisionase family DNA binding protein